MKLTRDFAAACGIETVFTEGSVAMTPKNFEDTDWLAIARACAPQVSSVHASLEKDHARFEVHSHPRTSSLLGGRGLDRLGDAFRLHIPVSVGHTVIEDLAPCELCEINGLAAVDLGTLRALCHERERSHAHRWPSTPRDRTHEAREAQVNASIAIKQSGESSHRGVREFFFNHDPDHGVAKDVAS
jgi:hypothetical protein